VTATAFFWIRSITVGERVPVHFGHVQSCPVQFSSVAQYVRMLSVRFRFGWILVFRDVGDDVYTVTSLIRQRHYVTWTPRRMQSDPGGRGETDTWRLWRRRLIEFGVWSINPHKKTAAVDRLEWNCHAKSCRIAHNGVVNLLLFSPLWSLCRSARLPENEFIA